MVTVMVMNDLLSPHLCNVNPSHSEIQLFQNLTMKIHGQGHVCGQKSRWHLTFNIHRSRSWSRSNPLVTFEAWSSIDMFAFVSRQSDDFWLRCSKFHIWPWKFKVIWPWKFKVKVKVKVKPDGHIWGLEFNRYVCFSFRASRTLFGWDIANSIFDLENSRSRSQRKSTKIWSGDL